MSIGYNASFYEEVKQLDKIAPVSTSTQVNGAWVSAKDCARLVAKFETGVIAATGTITFQVRQAQDAAGTGAKALVAAAGFIDTSDGKAVWLDIEGSAIDQDNGFSFVRLEIVAATAASLVFAELLGYVHRYGPVVQPVTLLNA